MRTVVQEIFRQLLRLELGVAAAGEIPVPAPAQAEAVCALAKHHDLGHLAAHALVTAGSVAPADSKALVDQVFEAMWRCEQQRYELQRITAAMEAARILFVPLKGVVMRERYPADWMRTSADIDLLVRKEDYDAAMQVLAASLGYREEGSDSHHTVFHTVTGVSVELHFTLIEDYRYPQAVTVLNDIWQYVSQVPGRQYQAALSDAMFYYYHVAHMTKHFENGGCGVRSLIDLWLLQTNDPEKVAARDALLVRGGLQTFEQEMRQLAAAWFGDGSVAAPEDVEQYVLTGGTYGVFSHGVVTRQKKHKTACGYWLSRVFQPYRELKYQYPILQKAPVLVPVFWVVRLCRLANPDVRRRARGEIHAKVTVNEQETEKITNMMKRLGIW